jgi:hypothetical protein
MFAPGDRELEAYAPGCPVGPASPGLDALSWALTALADISDAVTLAVQRHDRIALEQSNVRAEKLVLEVNALAESLTERDRALVAETGIGALCERLAAGGRRNAYLIEQAWAVDAALMRMLVGIGKVSPDGTGYGSAPAQAFVDRQA